MKLNIKNITAVACTALVLQVGLNTSAQARPVSYPGGWTSMVKNDGDKNSVHFHYSPTAEYSVGYLAEYWRDDSVQFHGVQVNNLIKRWNNDDSQANLYLKSGAGISIDDGRSEASGFTGFSADWEDRRFFISYGNRYSDFGDNGDGFSQNARIGVAPYIGEYGDLHTWVMLQADHNPESDNNITVTPLVRFFKGTHLVEIGYSSNKTALFNWVARF